MVDKMKRLVVTLFCRGSSTRKIRGWQWPCFCRGSHTQR